MEYPVFQFNQESWDAMGFDQNNVVDDQAYAALRLSKKRNEQVEIVAATLDKAKQNDTSPNLYTRLDNRNLPESYTKEMMANAISPLLKRTVAKSPERAAYFMGDQLEKWNAAAREEEAFRQHQSYIDTLLENAEKNAGTSQSAFERQQSAEEARKRRETWKQIQEQAKINKVVNALDAYWPTDFRKETDSILDARLELLNQMGIDTLGVSREELRKTKGYQFREAVNLFGALDAVSRGEDIVWAVDAWNGGVLSDELSHVDENSPLYVQEKMLDLLRKERYATMPETTSEKMLNSLFKSVSFMTEMAATSGMGEMLGLVKAGGTPMLDKLLADGFRKLIQENGWKGVRQAVKEGVKRAGANAIGRIPAYAPSLALNTFGDVAPSVVTVPDDFGNPAITVKERDVTDFIQRLITNTVVQATEMFTEELGPLIPLGDLDARMLTGLLPKTVRNFVAQNLIRNPATRRIAERAILDRVPFDGLIGEFGEEAIGQFMLFGATLLGQGLGFRPENTPGVTSPIMSGAEAGETLASIALQSVLFRGLQVAHAEMSGTGAVAMVRDAQRAKRERAHFDTMSDLISETRLAQSNLNEAQATVDLLLNGDTSVVVAPGEVENILLQATEGKTDAEANEARATLAQAGITQDAIDKARKDGTDVILSKNRLLALSSNKGFKNAKELVHTILDNEATEVFGKTTKELTADSFTKEQIDEMTDRAERQQAFLRDAQKIMSAAVRTAQKNAKDSGNKLGISQQNVRDFVSIYSLLANYLSKNVETEEGMKELESMVKNLSVQFAENPEKFDASGSLAQIISQDIGFYNYFGTDAADFIRRAEALEAAKASPLRIWGETGLFRGADGKWRAEIPDLLFNNTADDFNPGDGLSVLHWYQDTTRVGWELQGLVEADDLFRAYPRLRRFRVRFGDLGGPGTRGQLDFDNRTIWLNTNYYLSPQLMDKIEDADRQHQVDDQLRVELIDLASQMRGTVVHEVQHAIQFIEGNARGSNTREMRDDWIHVDDLDPKIKALRKKAEAPRKRKEKTGRAFRKSFEAAGYKVYDGKILSEFGAALYDVDDAESLLKKLQRDGNHPGIIRALEDFIRDYRELQDIYDEMDAVSKDYFGRYRRVAGEVEARTVQARMNMSPEKRRDVAPFETEESDVPRKDQIVLYQDADTVVKGQIDLARFAESQEAIITLFKDADASTLPHESAHWLKAAMESLVGAGFATDKMKEDLDTINAWLDKQDYKGLDDTGKRRAREEYFARAFEQYLREGRFPEAASTGLKSALRRLGRMLQSIYRNALALNAPIDDSIRNFFDDIFTVEEVVDGTSLLSGILREINAGAITMNKEELANLESDIAAAKEDAESQAWLAALQAYQKGLREQRTLWRNEAQEAYADSKAEQAYAYVRAGHKLDENFLRNVLNLDEDTISILRKKRLTVKGAAAPAKEATPEAGVPAAPTGPATELTGDAAQFDALPDDAVVTLPADAEAAQNVLAMLTHGMDGNGGPIWKRAKTVKSATKENGLNASDITDSMKAGYDAALKLLQSGEPVTKGGLIGYFATSAYNSIKNVYNAAAKQQDDGIVSLQETTQSGEGDTQELGDITPDKSAPTVATGMDYDTLLDIMSDWTDTFKDGTKKAVAEIIYEFAAEGVIEPTNKEIWNEYKNRGFDNAVTQGRVESVIPSVKASREAYFKSRNVTLNQAAESVEVPADILATMNELGYADVGSLIADLRSAVGRAQFIKDYVNQKHAEYRSAFLDNPEWSSESGATRYLDALLSALKVTSGIKFSERVKIARAEAERELKASGTVRDIVKGERGVAKSLSSNAAAILKALKADEGDKAAAVTAALDMHRNAARLQAIRTLRAEIQKLTKRAQRIGKSKPGSTLDGDTINAVKSLLFRFRLSGALPQWTTGPNDPQSVLDVMKEFTPDIDAELKKWSPWMQRVLTGEEAPTSWENLTPDQFYELTDLIDYLRGEGHDSLAEQKGTFANAFVEAMDAILPSVEAHKTGDYTDTEDKTMLQKLGSLARSGIHQMKTLVFMAHLLDGRTEFYGDHVIGPVRKFFQLPLSEGASRELFWYQKVSGEVKPHILALMRSAKERKLVFPVNNEETRRRAYPDLHGEQAAFVLLNAGATENRARLMESFGWSEDELDGILRQFTKEDFEHAEAIWKALREMGTELAKVYFEERHYRMKWAELTPISMTLNDGSTILSEGGYYPLAYRYHDFSRGFDPDIMNPFTRTFRPTRPTATFARSSNLTDLSLLMSPSVIEQSIRENAHYIGMWQPLRMANAIWTNKDFKQAVIHNFGRETYDALKQLMDNVNNPDKGETGLWKKAAQKLGACLATAALGFKITTMAKQYASLTIGAERLGGYFSDAVSYALHDLRGLRREVSNLSPFMRDRYNLMDRDLKVVNTEFKKPLAKAADKYRYAAFWGLKQNDLNVAAVQWYAAYNWALDAARGMTKDQARAYADDFVATTQGAARTIDTPVVQLETLGRLLTPFFGPACAAANTRIAGLSVLKDMDAGERIAFAIDNFMVPGLVMALVAAVRSGLADPDDDDDWDRIRKQSLTALLTEPISGVPVVQDIADATVRAAVTGKPIRNGIFEVSLFRPAEQASRDFIDLMENWNNLGYSLYVGASLTGQLLEMPVVQVYEEYEKMYQWNFGDEDSKSLKKQLKGEKRK